MSMRWMAQSWSQLMTRCGGISSIATTDLISIIYVFSYFFSKLDGVTLAFELDLLFVKPILHMQNLLSPTCGELHYPSKLFKG